MFPKDRQEWLLLRFQEEVLPEEVPRAVQTEQRLFFRCSLIPKHLQIAGYSFLKRDGAPERRPVAQPWVAVDGPYQFAQTGRLTIPGARP